MKNVPSLELSYVTLRQGQFNWIHPEGVTEASTGTVWDPAHIYRQGTFHGSVSEVHEVQGNILAVSPIRTPEILADMLGLPKGPAPHWVRHTHIVTGGIPDLCKQLLDLLHAGVAEEGVSEARQMQHVYDKANLLMSVLNKNRLGVFELMTTGDECDALKLASAGMSVDALWRDYRLLAIATLFAAGTIGILDNKMVMPYIVRATAYAARIARKLP